MSSATCCSSRSCPSRRPARVAAEHARAPERRAGQARLAWEMCALIHGAAAADEAAAASTGFTSAAGSLSAEQLAALTDEIPTTHTEIAGRDVVDLLVESGLAASKGEARRLIAGGGIYVNDVALAESRALGADDLLHGRYVMLRKGKRQRHLLVAQLSLSCAQARSAAVASAASSTTWMRPFASRRRPPSRPARTADDLGQDGDGGLLRRVRADVEADRPRDALELLVADARLAQAVAALLLRAAGAERADVADAAPQRARDGRVVQLGIVREHRDVILGPQLDLVVALLGPLHDELVRPTGCARRSRRRRADR